MEPDLMLWYFSKQTCAQSIYTRACIHRNPDNVVANVIMSLYIAEIHKRWQGVFVETINYELHYQRNIICC